MDGQDLTQLTIEISESDSAADDIDRMTRQLLFELRELDVESAKLAKSGLAPAGAKGDPITIGAIALELLPAVLPSVVSLVQAWVSRGRGRTVKFKGMGFEFEGSPEDLQKILATLEKGKGK